MTMGSARIGATDAAAPCVIPEKSRTPIPARTINNPTAVTTMESLLPYFLKPGAQNRFVNPGVA
jgi:hypothetical protein